MSYILSLFIRGSTKDGIFLSIDLAIGDSKDHRFHFIDRKIYRIDVWWILLNIRDLDFDSDNDVATIIIISLQALINYTG